MTISQLINKSARTLNMTQMAVGPNTQANLISQGFDGTMWMGECPAEGRKKAVSALFYRNASGSFVQVL